MLHQQRGTDRVDHERTRQPVGADVVQPLLRPYAVDVQRARRIDDESERSRGRHCARASGDRRLVLEVEGRIGPAAKPDHASARRHPQQRLLEGTADRAGGAQHDGLETARQALHG